jgi:two-component system chemotaxis response regulator CheB
VVQHVHARFAPAIAQTLDQVSKARVQLAEPDLPLRTGHVYLAPGDRHLLLGGTNQFHTKLRTGELISGHRPSVDALFHSVAKVAGANAVGVLLTGMGADGANGLLAMARAGAPTIAQDEASCTVFGMPRAAIELGAAQAVLPLQRIASQLLRGRQTSQAA